jgi:hypothetical protein
MGANLRKAPDPRQYYPGVDARWPFTNYRRFWTWIFDWGERRRLRRPYVLSEEWGPGQHIPGMFRQNYWTNVFTRWVVPVDENVSRLFYFHAARPSNWIGRAYERVNFKLIRNWLMNKNFSEQDMKGAVYAYYNTPEHLSPSDIQTIMWRKFLLTARGLQVPKDVPLAGAADVFERETNEEPAGVSS